MTNSIHKMAGKSSGTPGRVRTTGKPRVSALRVPTALYSTPEQPIPEEVGTRRMPPSLVGGHFAGGKWSEPPSPATLPKPPQHWTQLIFVNKCAHGKPAPAADIASQLKVLLNVQG